MKKYIFLGAAMLLLTAACSNDENSNPKEQPTQAVQFSFNNEDFGADETLSRATGAAETKPQTVDLGDCEAEISVENEPAVKTRGTMTNASGHYTIRAYQGGTLKGEMKGTFSGGAFTPDATSPQDIVLSAGTYDFIAFNDDVIPSGNDLTVDRTKAETARMGTTTAVITATPQKQKVSFTMKHVGCRLHTQFVCQKDIPENITAKLEQTVANAVPTHMTYNILTQAKTYTNGAMTAENSSSPASTENSYTASNYGQNYAYTSTSSDYHYFLPTTEGSKLKLTFTAGTLFWKPLTGTIPQLNATLQMQAGKSYLVKIKLKPNYIYLMSDGTTGHFKDTTFGGGTKTPVGVVADPVARVAIALKDIGDGTLYPWSTLYPPVRGDNTTIYIEGSNEYEDMDGYKWTWEPAGTTDGTIKADQQTDYPAFYAVGHYNPGVTVSGTLVGKKWYLAGWGEWVTYISLGLGFAKNINDAIDNFSYGILLEEALTKVGGKVLDTTDEGLGKKYLMSTQILNGFDPTPNTCDRRYYYKGGGVSGAIPGNITGRIRPFIKY